MNFTISWALSSTLSLLFPRVSRLQNAPCVSSKSRSATAFQMPCTSSGGRGIYWISAFVLRRKMASSREVMLTILGYDHINVKLAVSVGRST